MTHKIAVLWPLLPSYMACCLKTLVAEYGYDVRLFCLGPDGLGASDAFVEPHLFSPVEMVLWTKSEFQSRQVVRDAMMDCDPNLLVVSGWNNKAFRRLLFEPNLSETPIVLASDNSFKNTPKQWMGRFVLRRVLDRVNRVIVPGDRGNELMKFYGIPQQKIRRGLYSIDFKHFNRAVGLRRGLSRRPRNFLFVGRLRRTQGTSPAR